MKTRRRSFLLLLILKKVLPVRCSLFSVSPKFAFMGYFEAHPSPSSTSSSLSATFCSASRCEAPFCFKLRLHSKTRRARLQSDPSLWCAPAACLFFRLCFLFSLLIPSFTGSCLFLLPDCETPFSYLVVLGLCFSFFPDRGMSSILRDPHSCTWILIVALR